MIPQTAIGSALVRAGVNVGEGMLYALAAECLRKAHGDPDDALSGFVDALVIDSPMVSALIGREDLARRAKVFLNSVAGDMSGTRGGRLHVDALTIDAPATNSDGDGQRSGANLGLGAASSETISDGEGRPASATLSSRAPLSEPYRVRGGQSRGAFQTIHAFPRANHPRGLSAVKTMGDIKRSVMDTYRIDGRSIGDWTLGEAVTAGREKSRHGALLTAIGRRYANADSSTLIRDAIKIEDLQREIQRAAETSDAA